MSRLILFVLTDSSCVPREESENDKMKNSCSQRYSKEDYKQIIIIYKLLLFTNYYYLQIIIII